MSDKLTKNCIFNDQINCAKTGRQCHKCGWNPEVTARRLGKGANR